MNSFRACKADFIEKYAKAEEPDVVAEGAGSRSPRSNVHVARLRRAGEGRDHAWASHVARVTTKLAARTQVQIALKKMTEA